MNFRRFKRAINPVTVTIWAIMLCCLGSQGQGGNLGSNSSPVVNRNGLPMANVNISVCQPLATNGGTVTSGLAAITMASNPLTAGFAPNMTILVSGFSGVNDAALNAGTLTNGTITNGWTILSVTSTQIIFSTGTSSSYSLTTNGTILQEGNQVTSCGGLASVYSDPALPLTSLVTQPFQSDQLGNWNVFAASGLYYVQFYSAVSQTTIKQIAAGASSPIVATCKNFQNIRCVDVSNSSGWSGSDPGAWITSAINSLPCTFPNGYNTGTGNPVTVTAPCGNIMLATGVYNFSTSTDVTSSAIAIIGSGQGTVLNCPSSLSCIEFNAPQGNGDANNFGGGVYNLVLRGNGSANQFGVLSLSTTGTQFVHVSASGFTGSGSYGILMQNNATGIGERIGGYDVQLENNTCGLGYTAVTNTSFGHQFWNKLMILPFVGQTAICVGPSSQIYSSTFEGVINSTAQVGSATALSISGTGSAEFISQLNMAIDAGGSETITTCSGCTTSNFKGWGWVLGNSTEMTNFNNPLFIQTPTNNTPLASLSFATGSDPRSGTLERTLFLDSNNNVAEWDQPNSVSRGPLATIGGGGAQGISAGTVTLSGGAGSHNFTAGYGIAPVCTATDQTATNAVNVTSSTSTVTLAGTGTDVITWICIPATN